MDFTFNNILEKVLNQKGNAFFYTPHIYKGARSYLFENCASSNVISSKNSSTGIKEIEVLLSSGSPAYGMINYEYGYYIEEKLRSFTKSDEAPIAKFNFFNKVNFKEFDSKEIVIIPDQFREYEIQKFRISIDEDDYKRNINKIKEHIYRGDTYQVNYTVDADFVLSGSIKDLIFNLIFNQSARYISIINDDPELIISLSPELFFELKNNVLISKPMKGTVKRGCNVESDKMNRNILLSSEKDLAENTMIVDLLRNDFGKISNVDSVKVSNKYELEKYESVYQLTSTIRGIIEDSRLSNILENIFPCGSITGAPKIRTMEIIRQLEVRDRGIYTGAIGMAFDSKFIFNVPIRTIKLNIRNKTGKIGIGSGIVWDSDPDSEYDEVKLKAQFLTNAHPYFELFESMLVTNRSVTLLDYHVQRIKESADYFLFKFYEQSFRSEVNNIISQLDEQSNYKLKVTLNKWGKFNSNCNFISEQYNDVKVIVSSTKINPSDKFQYFKTTNRKTYDEEYNAYNQLGYYDCLYINNDNELCEGSRNNVIISKNGKLFTPPVSSGILNGCYRQYLLETGKISETNLTVEDLITSGEVYLCNAVRGLVKVNKIDSFKEKPLKTS